MTRTLLGGSALLLLGHWMPALGQAGDAEPLAVISLPAEEAPRPKARIEPQCGALILSQAMKFRPGLCQSEQQGEQQASVEGIEIMPQETDAAPTSERRPPRLHGRESLF